MKCQKCGKNEVNFHYSSNVNGCVTETHLCSGCAAEIGYDLEKIMDSGHVFDLSQNLGLGSIFGGMFPGGMPAGGMLPLRSGNGGFMPMAIPMMQTNTVFPFTIQPHSCTPQNAHTAHGREDTCGCGCGGSASGKKNVEVNEKMSRRRELNMQMRAAIEKEDFEKAAELRDKIRELEA